MRQLALWLSWPITPPPLFLLQDVTNSQWNGVSYWSLKTQSSFRRWKRRKLYKAPLSHGTGMILFTGTPWTLPQSFPSIFPSLSVITTDLYQCPCHDRVPGACLGIASPEVQVHLCPVLHLPEVMPQLWPLFLKSWTLFYGFFTKVDFRLSISGFFFSCI